jgi:hypothetical protein
VPAGPGGFSPRPQRDSREAMAAITQGWKWEFVARAGLLDSYLLYSLRGGACVFPALAVDLTGRIVFETQPTRWLAEELMDTGRTLPELFVTTPGL